MSENDVTKMKVADLKRELKMRGLAITGNKNELQDRLQTALIEGDGELTFDDTGEDLLDEDAVLTDEEDAKLLCADENELLKSPIPSSTTTEQVDKYTSPLNITNTLQSSPPKKLILKRRNSNNESEQKEVDSTTNIIASKENAASQASASKSERKPIIFGDNPSANAENSKPVVKWSELSEEKRKELRAKKFGGISDDNKTTASPVVGQATAVGPTDNKQIDLLKRRAERFGCVVSSKMAKLEEIEKLEKRKQRFGVIASNTTSSTSASNSPADWKEKAEKRLIRFGNTDN